MSEELPPDLPPDSEPTLKPARKPKTKPGSYAKPMQFPTEEARKAYEKRVREDRIEQIAVIMRSVSTKTGKMAWTSKVRKTLGAMWGLPDWQVKKYAALASKRVLNEIMQGEGMFRHASSAFMDAVAHAHAKKDWKTIAALMAQAIAAVKLTREKPQEAPPDVSAEAAQAAVRKFFGDKAAKKTDESLATRTVESGDGAQAAPAGRTEDAGSPSGT